MTTNHHSPITADGQPASAATFNTRFSSLDSAITTEATTRAAADTTLQTNITAEAAARLAADTAASTAQGTALTAETNARAAADAAIQAQVTVLSAVASTSGGTGITTLSRLAGAAEIDSIGGDGVTTTVLTVLPHGYVDGDFVTISGTTNYNDAETAAINVLSTTEFEYASPVNAATETSGYARTKRLWVASTSNFIAGQQISLTNEDGDLHMTTVSGSPSGGMIVLTEAVPTTWIVGAQAGIGSTVSSTLEEVRLSRTAGNYGGGLTPTLPKALAWAGEGKYNLKAYGALGDGATDDSAALTAVLAALPSTGGVVTLPRGHYKFSTPIEITSKLGVTIEGAGGRYNVNYANSSTILEYTGSGSTPAIKVDTNDARNFRMRNIALTYSNPLFTGSLLNLGDTIMSGCTFENVYFGGPGLTSGTALYSALACVTADCAEFFTFDKCYFTEAQYGYLGGNVQQSGVKFRDCVFGDLTIAQIRSTAFQGIAWEIAGCGFDPIRLAPTYGIDLAANGIDIHGCGFVGVSALVAPTTDFIKLTGRGAITGCYMSSADGGIRLGGHFSLRGNHLLGPAPVIVESGVFEERANHYVINTSGVTGVDIVPGVVATTAFDCGPSRFEDDGGGVTASYRVTPVNSGVTGEIRYSANMDTTDSEVVIASGAERYVRVINIDKPVLYALPTLDFPSIAANSQASLTTTVTGAATGDLVMVAPNVALETGLSSEAWVSAADTVTIRLSNLTAGAIDPASRAWRIKVERF